MSDLFRNILVPVDFTVSTQVAIEKALCISAETPVNLHLLHVQSPTVFSRCIGPVMRVFAMEMEAEKNETDTKMGRLEDLIRSRRANITVLHWNGFGDIENTIAKKASQIMADVIIIGKKSGHSRLPFLNTVVPSRLATKTGIPVLTVKPGSMDSQIKTVVIPLEGGFPERKLAMINAVRRKNWIQIRLIAFSGGNEIQSILPLSLQETYRHLRSSPGSEVTCNILYGSNKARAILEYCRKVDADLVIVTPGTETRIGWFNKHIADMLPPESKTQVLAIE